VAARVLNRRAPDDLGNYAAIVEAGIALKRLDEAEEAAQWMLDLRPDDLTCAEHAALVRAAEGDPEGALELLIPAAKVISPERAFESAWVATESARCELALGHVEKARALVQAALGALPEYHVALALAAKIAARGGDHATAASFLRVRFENGPTDANRASLIEALERAGMCDEAAALSQ
jgi:tetratricopeptide (TPR) repeat protein